MRKRILSFLKLRNKLVTFKETPFEFKINIKRKSLFSIISVIRIEYNDLFKGKTPQSSTIESDRWTSLDDYQLFKGISRYGLEEWDRLISDNEVWGYLKFPGQEGIKYWKKLFKKIEGKEVPPNQEKECEM